MSDESTQPPKPLRPVKSDDELRQLCQDVYHGRVFCDFMVPGDTPGEHGRNLRHVFMVLGLMNQEQLEEFFARKPVMVYEYLEKASGRAYNGMPGFFSIQYLTEEEHQRWAPMFERYMKLQTEFQDGG